VIVVLGRIALEAAAAVAGAWAAEKGLKALDEWLQLEPAPAPRRRRKARRNRRRH